MALCHDCMRFVFERHQYSVCTDCQIESCNDCHSICLECRTLLCMVCADTHACFLEEENDEAERSYESLTDTETDCERSSVDGEDEDVPER